MNVLVRGVLGGAAATTAMSVPMLVAQRLGWMGKQPPERIVEAALDAADLDTTTNASEDVLAVASHYAFGIGCGVLFSVLHARRRLPGPAIVHGVAFGMMVWALSYLGWVPALGILPPAHRDRSGRRRTMVLGHVVYGAVLGATVARDHD